MHEEAFVREEAFYRNHPEAYEPYVGMPENFREFYEQNYRQLLEAMSNRGLRRSSRILTIGVGPGNRDLELILKESDHVVGLDVSEKALAICKRRFPNAACVLGSSHAVPFRDASFDFVLFVLVIHHLTGQKVSGLAQKVVDYALPEARRVLRDDGTVFCLEPNVLFPSTLAIYPVNAAMQRLKPGWRGLVPTERNISPFRLRRLLKRYGFSRVDFKATTFANSKLPRPIFRWLMTKEEGLRDHWLLRHFGVFTLVAGQK